MASADAGSGGSLPPNFFLTPQQQNLLFAALNPNKPQPNGGGLTLSPNSFETSPIQRSHDNHHHNNQAFNESPFLDTLNEDLGDSSFDFSFADDQQPRMIGELPQTVKSEPSDTDHHEKRSHPDDDEDDSQDPKRRESTDKVPKKPGRKPLTNEPTSKRKAQNRAAQRAFRERKEQHLKDLETKVEELTQASEQANHENTKLRAQVDQMTTELKQYKQRLSLMSNPTKPVARKDHTFGSSAVGNLADVNFQFNFPKFGGTLPGSTANKQPRSASQPISPQNSVASQPTKSRTLDNKSPSTFSDTQFKDDLAKFSGIFTPSMTSSSAGSASRASLDSAQYSLGGATSSPSASSNSNAGPSSSCGTSPEPFTQSPLGSKPIETMTTIGEEQSNTSSEPFAQFANIDFNNSTNFDWLANQNGGSFEPQLFGDFREPQENILSDPSYDDFFNDALNADFFTPFNVPPESSLGKADNTHTSSAPKANLIDAIDAQKEDYDDSLKPAKENMNCNQIWEKLQNCPKAQSGEFDLDGLCSELTKKAKCSGTGPVVGEKDFDSILNKYMGNYDSKCVANSLGIEVDRSTKSNGVGLP